MPTPQTIETCFMDTETYDFDEENALFCFEGCTLTKTIDKEKGLTKGEKFEMVIIDWGQSIVEFYKQDTQTPTHTVSIRLKFLKEDDDVSEESRKEKSKK